MNSLPLLCPVCEGLLQIPLASQCPSCRANVLAGSLPKGSPSAVAAQTIDGFKLIQVIGEGGCGIVYLAEQEQPVRRWVAVKVIKPGMDTEDVMQRFEAERQALALMEHPNIARVLDGGATRSGQSYFVMELVLGSRITEYCDRNGMSLENRLKLLVQVCFGINHAHQKGIIHRDLKPSNIIVTTQARKPLPKIIDFGVAKAITGQPLTEQKLLTCFEQFIGTPSYMSPEQAQSRPDIDSRSDVYSLGALLYQLLTGSTALETSDLSGSGVEEVRRLILEKEAVRPSLRLARMNMEETKEIARQRAVTPTLLIPFIRGDLDWIVMKALEKDRDRRYTTAHAFAMDLECYLNHQPVSASRPTAAYRIGKLMRRRRVESITSIAVALVIFVGVAISAWLMIKNKQAQKQAAAAQVAPERFRLETKLRELESLGSELRTQGRLEESEMIYREVLEIRGKFLHSPAPEIAATLSNLAEVLRLEGKSDKAERIKREAAATPQPGSQSPH